MPPEAETKEDIFRLKDPDLPFGNQSPQSHSASPQDLKKKKKTVQILQKPQDKQF